MVRIVNNQINFDDENVFHENVIIETHLDNEIHFNDGLFEDQHYDPWDIDLDFSPSIPPLPKGIDLSTIPLVPLDHPRIKGEEKKEILEEVELDEEVELEVERSDFDNLDEQLKNYFNK